MATVSKFDIIAQQVLGVVILTLFATVLACCVILASAHTVTQLLGVAAFIYIEYVVLREASARIKAAWGME